MVAGAPPQDQAKISALCRETERLEEDALYSDEGHFNAEDTWVRHNYWLNVSAAALGAIAGIALIKSQPEWTSALTLLASLLTELMTFLKPSEYAAMHRVATGQFLALQNEIRLFRKIELLGTDQLGKLPERLETLSSARNELNQKGPSISRRTFIATHKNIEEGETIHEVDREK